MAEDNSLSYFEQRMQSLGINPDAPEWQIEVYNPDAEWPQKDTALMPIFSEDKAGNIVILVYDINADLINYLQAGDGKMSHINGKMKHFSIKRLKVPIVKPDGSVQKYQMPKGQGTFPFFPPKLVEKFKNKTKIETLILTEGYFKAAKASMHGFDIVGLSSITHMADARTHKLHADITKLIIQCEVQRVVWLVDGDCLDISSSDIENKDLYKRPHGFFQTVNKFRDLMSHFPDLLKYFSHVISDQFPPILELNENGELIKKSFPKGLDDALIQVPGNESEILTDLTDFSKPSRFFYRQEVTFSAAKIHSYFNLHSVYQFWLYHSDATRRPDLVDKEFIFNGTRYKYNKDKQEMSVVIPAEASNYFRVGDQYHAWVHIPNKYNTIERTFHRRQKSTISDDHGKTIFQHIPKYQAFCNVPDHVNFQPVINGCFNVYAPFEFEPEPGEFTTTEKFLKHIFGTKDIKWRDPKDKTSVLTVNEYELALDYLTILYKYPTQILPILCLVSKENNTGKSTFSKFLKMIFTQNVAIVGNAELSDNFNAGWATKLLIICDEAKIDKQVVVEKVKSLSTTDKILMNAKGKDHVEIDFFGKFIFITNNEENFIYASDEDQRYWVRKVPVIQDLNVHLLQELQEEIPAFLHFLNTRKISVPNRHRGWFDPELIKTDALKRVVAYSAPTIEKELRTKLKDMFLDFGVEELMLSVSDIKDEWFKNKYEDNYITQVLVERLKVHRFQWIIYKGKKYERDEQLKKEFPDLDLNDPEIIRKQVPRRYQIPDWDRTVDMTGSQTIKRINKERNGRPFVFYAKQFLTPEELESLNDSDDLAIKRGNEIMNSGMNSLFPENQAPQTPVDDLPF